MVYETKKLCVVIPFRDRDKHLSCLLPELKRCLSGIDYEIIVVEQASGEDFNRGLLKNIGFSHSSNCDYVCFHDVDMMPHQTEYDYSYGEGAIHLANKVSQFDYIMPYEKFFGGVLLMTKEDFIKANGYNNKFWGWGAEDDDLYNRCKYNNIKTTNRICKFSSFPHERDEHNKHKNFEYRDYCFLNPEIYKTNGLNSMNYKILSTEDKQIKGVDFKLIKVSLLMKIELKGAGGVSVSINKTGQL